MYLVTFLTEHYSKLVHSLETCNPSTGLDKTGIDCLVSLMLVPAIMYKKGKSAILPTLEVNLQTLNSSMDYSFEPRAQEGWKKALYVWVPVLLRLEGKTRGTSFKYYKDSNLLVQFYFDQWEVQSEITDKVKHYIATLLGYPSFKPFVNEAKFKTSVTDELSTLIVPRVIHSDVLGGKILPVSKIDYDSLVAITEYRALVYTLTRGVQFRLEDSDKLEGIVSF